MERMIGGEAVAAVIDDIVRMMGQVRMRYCCGREHVEQI